MGLKARLFIGAAVTTFISTSTFAGDTISRDRAVSIGKAYVQGLHIGDVDCLSIRAHRGSTPPNDAPEAARQKMSQTPFWIVSLKPFEKTCAPATVIYVMTDTGEICYAANAR